MQMPDKIYTEEKEREVRLKRGAEYRALHKEKIDARNKAYKLAHPEKVREAKRKWAFNNVEFNKACKIAWQNSPEGKAKKKAYAQSPKGKEQKAAYRHSLRGKASAIVTNRKQKARLRSAEGSYTTQEWLDLKEKYGNHCLRCGKHQSELDRVLEQDHIVPLSKRGTNWIINIQPLCHDCNGMAGKGVKHTNYRESYLEAFDPVFALA